MNVYEIRYHCELDVLQTAVIIKSTLGEAWDVFKDIFPTRISSVTSVKIIAYDIVYP